MRPNWNIEIYLKYSRPMKKKKKKTLNCKICKMIYDLSLQIWQVVLIYRQPMSITLSLLNFSQGGLDFILNIQEHRQLLAYNLYLKTAFFFFCYRTQTSRSVHVVIFHLCFVLVITLLTLYSVFPSTVKLFLSHNASFFSGKDAELFSSLSKVY